MSTKERRRLTVLGQVGMGRLSVAAAGRLLGISERQARRLWKRYRESGDAGLAHRLCGRPGNRRSAPGLRERALTLFAEHYADYGPTLAAECLGLDHGVVVGSGTLRRWLIEAGLWRARRRRPAKRERRPRKLCFGELVQLDGSDHAWFGDGRPRCVLMVMIDDATSWIDAWFFEAETTAAAMTIFGRWARRHGLPGVMYPDRHSIYRRNDAEADEVADRTGKRPLTQFGRAMKELDVRLTCAHSPRAKGRVERVNRTLQDRLVKALARAGITTIGAANAYLDEVCLARHNARFAVEPAAARGAGAADVHVPTSAASLDAALVHRESRKVGSDQCVSFEGQVLQLRPGRETPSLAGKRVEVERTPTGRLRVKWRGRAVTHELLDARPKPAKMRATAAERVADHKPPTKPGSNHPWRAPVKPSRSPGGHAPLRLGLRPRLRSTCPTQRRDP